MGDYEKKVEWLIELNAQHHHLDQLHERGRGPCDLSNLSSPTYNSSRTQQKLVSVFYPQLTLFYHKKNRRHNGIAERNLTLSAATALLNNLKLNSMNERKEKLNFLHFFLLRSTKLQMCQNRQQPSCSSAFYWAMMKRE